MTAWQNHPERPCAKKDPELFFPTSTGGPAAERQIAEAKAVCVGCPVLEECLEYAVARHEQGVWGGTSEADRRALRAAA